MKFCGVFSSGFPYPPAIKEEGADGNHEHGNCARGGGPKSSAGPTAKVGVAGQNGGRLLSGWRVSLRISRERQGTYASSKVANLGCAMKVTWWDSSDAPSTDLISIL